MMPATNFLRRLDSEIRRRRTQTSDPLCSLVTGLDNLRARSSDRRVTSPVPDVYLLDVLIRI